MVVLAERVALVVLLVIKAPLVKQEMLEILEITATVVLVVTLVLEVLLATKVLRVNQEMLEIQEIMV